MTSIATHENLRGEQGVIPPTPLIGRSREVEQLLTMLERNDARLITLTGPGGVGKTRLAVEATDAASASFPGGTFVVGLAGLDDSSLLLSVIARSMGIRDDPGIDVISAMATVLSNRRTMLTLDNLEQLLPDGAASDVARLVARYPELTILVTSRFPLHVRGEQEFALQPLQLPPRSQRMSVADVAASPAVQMFIDRAQASTPGFRLDEQNAESIARICRRLDGLPLALELAAAWIKVLTPAALEARLDSVLRMPISGAIDLPARQQTLRHTIEWSYRLLTEDEKRLLRLLGVFKGGFTLRAAEAVSESVGIDPGSVLFGVSALLDKNFIYRDSEADNLQLQETRFNLLESIREFALEACRTEDKLDEIYRGHTRYFCDLAREATRGFFALEMVPWWEVLEQDIDNLRTALTWSVEGGHTALAMRLGVLGTFWAHRGYLSEALQWYPRILALEGEVAPDIRLIALFGEAWVTRSSARFEEAIELYDVVIDLARSIGDEMLVFESQLTLATVLVEVARLDEAEQVIATLTASPVLASALPFWAAAYHWALGDFASMRGDFDRADIEFSNALERIRETGSRRNGAYLSSPSLTGLGYVAFERGNHGAAVGYYMESFVAAEEIGFRWGMATALFGTSRAAAALGHLTEAARFYGAADALRATTGASKRRFYGEDPQAFRQELDRALGADQAEAELATGRQSTPAEALSMTAAFSSNVNTGQPIQKTEQFAHLSSREIEVLSLLASGLTNAKIAERLFISPRTVDTHVRHVYEKLGASNRSDAVRIALKHGLG